MTAKKKPVGELNGPYALLFRINMILIPIATTAVLGWGAWVTQSIMEFEAFITYGERFSQEDADALENRCDAHSDHNMATHVRDLHK